MIQDTIQSDTFAPRVEQGIWGPRYRALTIGLALTVAGVAFEALAVAATMPVTTRDLGGVELYGWAFSAFMLANLFGTVVAGSEADRQGPARPFIVGVLLFVSGLLVGGFAPSMPILVVARAIQGLGGGALSSVAYVAVGRGFPEGARARMLAVLSSAWVVPGLVGPALAGLVADHLGWRWVFLGLAPLTPLAAMLALPALRGLSRPATTPRDWSRARTAGRLAAGAALVLGGLGVPSVLLAPALLIFGAALALPALQHLMPAGTLRAAPGLPATIATAALLNLAFFGADTFVPLALTTVRGQATAVAGLALTAATITWTTGAWLQAHFAASQSRRRLVTLGLALIAVGIAAVALTLLPETAPLLAAGAWGVAGLGMGLAFSTLSLTILDTAASGQEGTAASSLQLANMLGTALGTGVGGVVVGAASTNISAGISAQYLLMIGITALAALAARGLPAR